MSSREASAPRISIVTPVLDQRRFIAAALDSVINQGYPNLDYIVIDGGSTDGTAAIVESYGDHLTNWTSEKDGGLYDALNKGFAKSSGEVMGWLNGDDMHTPWALHVIAEIFTTFPDVSWITTLYPLYWDARGFAVRAAFGPNFSRAGFFRGENLPGSGRLYRGCIQQESTFWRRSLWEAAGGHLNSSLQLAGDFDLWTRFFGRAHLYGVATPLAGFRRHGDQKSIHDLPRYFEEGKASLVSHGGRIPGRAESFARRVVDYIPSKSFSARGPKVCSFDTSMGHWKIEPT